jgi:hypothetical protein
MIRAVLLSTPRRTRELLAGAGSDHHHQQQPRNCLSGGVPPSMQNSETDNIRTAQPKMLILGALN